MNSWWHVSVAPLGAEIYSSHGTRRHGGVFAASGGVPWLYLLMVQNRETGLVLAYSSECRLISVF